MSEGATMFEPRWHKVMTESGSRLLMWVCAQSSTLYWRVIDRSIFMRSDMKLPRYRSPVARSNSMMDRDLARPWIPDGFAPIVLEVAAACCRTLLALVEPRDYRVTFRPITDERALAKYFYMTEVMENEGYSVLARGTDPGARTFWLMGTRELTFLRVKRKIPLRVWYEDEADRSQEHVHEPDDLRGCPHALRGGS